MDMDRYKLILDFATEGFWDWDMKADRTYISPRYCEMIGYSPDDTVFDSAFLKKILYPDDQQRVFQVIEEYIHGKRNTSVVEQRLITKDGTILWTETRGNVVEYDEHGKPTRMVGTISDISERKKMEESIRESEALLRAIIESIPFDVTAIDRTGQYCLQSPVSEGLWGNIIGKRPEDILIDDTIRNRWLENNLLALSGTTVQGEVDYMINNERRHFIETVTPICTASGEIFGVLGINIDQTERKQVEEERQLLEEQLIQAQKMESIGRLAGGVAHDFNNLLTPIMCYTELLKRDFSGNEGAATKTVSIMNAAVKAKNLVQELLCFSRKQVLDMKTIDLNKTIKSFNSILRHTIRESVDIRLCLAEKSYCIRADSNKIEQIIMNLAVNAQDAIGEVGTITIETSPVLIDDEYARQHRDLKPGHYMMLAVTDDGCGMDQETQQRIFEPFFTTKEVGKGTGLGLATVYGIVRQHGGSIWVHSESGKETKFKCYFPIVDEAPVCNQSTAHDLTWFVGEKRTILLVEDNEMVRTLVDELLTKNGFKVLVAEDPVQALRISEGHTLDLLVSDVVMPDMTGPEVHSKLIENHPGLRVLYMSGYASNVIAQQGVFGNGVQYIQKPFTIAEFAKKIEQVLME